LMIIDYNNQHMADYWLLMIDDWWLLYIDISISPNFLQNAFFDRHPEAAAALGDGLASPRACGEGWTSLPHCRVRPENVWKCDINVT
jgi:hypothetical protein